MIKRNTFAYVYFLTRVFFIGYGFSLIFTITNKDSWISFILGEILSIGLVFIITILKKKYEKRPFLKEKGHLILKGLYFLFATFVSIEILFIFQTLASNFFLLKSPNTFIILPSVLLVFRICVKGFKTIGRVGSVLMTISLVMVIIVLATLTTYVKTDNFLPILTVNKSNIFISSIYYMAYSTSPLLFLILIPDTDNHLVRYYLLSSLTIILMGVLMIGILGPNFLEIYRYPEYMVLKDIKILDFIEKVENVFSMATLFDLFMVLAISMNVVKIKLKKNNYLFALVLLIVSLVSLYLGKNYSLALELYYYLPMILIVFTILIITVFLISLRKNR